MTEDFIGGIGENFSAEKRQYRRISIPLLVGISRIHPDDHSFHQRTSPFSPDMSVFEKVRMMETQISRTVGALSLTADMQSNDMRMLIDALKSIQAQNDMMIEALRAEISIQQKLLRVSASISLGGLYIPCPPSWVGYNDLGEKVSDGIVAANDLVEVLVLSDQTGSLPLPVKLIARVLRMSHVKNGRGIPDEFGLAFEFLNPKETHRREVLAPIIGADNV